MRKIRLTGLLTVLLCATACLSFGQSEEDNTITGNGMYLGVFYGSQWPAGDLSDRFGNNFSVGANFELFLNQKWVLGVEGQFLFGNDVKENVLGGILTNEGHIINVNYALAEVDVKERGINLFAKFGRIHDLWSDQHVSGLKWTVGAGYLQHKIRLKDTQNAVPFFNDDYVKGYDRLSNGFALTEFIGYQYLDGQGRLNFFLGVEFTEGFTKNRRGLNYNTATRTEGSRFDMLVGIKAGIQITFKQFKNPEEIWY